MFWLGLGPFQSCSVLGEFLSLVCLPFRSSEGGCFGVRLMYFLSAFWGCIESVIVLKIGPDSLW